MPLEEATISVLDRGFIFGDGVYELIPVYSRQPFRLSDHLNRLQNSLDAIRLQNPHTTQEWQNLLSELIKRNPYEDQSVYMHITRGVAKRDHAFPGEIKQTVFMMSNPLVTPTAEQCKNGVSAISASDNRWLRCDIKAISLLPNVLLRQLAIDKGAVETVLFRDGHLTEGAASNIFVVHNDTLLAPPKNNLMLPGITYDLILELAAMDRIPCNVGPVSEATVRQAQELWQTSSTREVLAITQLDGKPVGDGKPGPMFHRMHALYQEYKRTVMRGKPA